MVPAEGIVKLRLKAVSDAQHGGFATGLSPVSWGSIDELFVNLTIPDRLIRHSDTPFGKEIFDISETQAETVVEPDGVTDDF